MWRLRGAATRRECRGPRLLVVIRKGFPLSEGLGKSPLTQTLAFGSESRWKITLRLIGSRRQKRTISLGLGGCGVDAPCTRLSIICGDAIDPWACTKDRHLPALIRRLLGSASPLSARALRARRTFGTVSGIGTGLRSRGRVLRACRPGLRGRRTRRPGGSGSRRLGRCQGLRRACELR